MTETIDISMPPTTDVVVAVGETERPMTPSHDAASGPAGHSDEDEIRQMSPRRNSNDMEQLTLQTADQLRHAKLLQESLLGIFTRIESVKEEHDKLDSNNKFLQKYIGDLMSTTNITATGGRSKK
jgi:hypothetical protein